MVRPEISRRRLLRLLGYGTAGGLAVGAHPWLRHAASGTEPPPGPTIPPPSLPDPTLRPTTTPTVAELAAGLEWDIDAMFRFVADEVAYEPYVGGLRGATGTLWGRTGNSVDKSLLLAALLAESRVPYRFVIGELEEQHAEAMLTATTVDVATVKRHAAAVILPPEVAEPWTGEGPWDRAPEVETLLDSARSQIEDGVRTIESALADADVTVEAPASTLPEQERSRHVWLQYADGPYWIDLDPSIPAAEPAVAYAAESEAVGELPDDTFHTVTVRIVAEVVNYGVPTRTELLNHRIRSVDVPGTPVVIVHPSAEWLGIGAALTGEQQYVPTLLIGDEIVEGSPITLRTGEGVVDVLSEDTDQAEGQTLAEWFEIDVNTPDGNVRQATRAIFDRLTPADRDAGTIDLSALPPVELTHIDDEIGDVYLPYAGPLILSVMAQPLPWSYFADDVEALEHDKLIMQSALAYHSFRDICRLENLDALGHRFYADEPTVIALSYTATAVPEPDVEEITIGVDILSSHSRWLDLEGGGATWHPGIVAGVVDHVAERLVTESPFTLPESPLLTGSSTGRVFELAAAAEIPIVTLQPGDDVGVADISDAVQAMIGEALVAGRIVIVPARSVEIDGLRRIGWWEVDPQTGGTIDRLDTGGHATIGEYARLLWRLWQVTKCERFMAKMIVMVVKGCIGVHSSNAKVAWDVATGAAGGIGCLMSI